MTASEFSHPIAADEIPSGGLRVKIEADADQRAALASRFGLLALDALSGRFELRPLAGGPMIRVDGRIEARLSQPCVVTEAPVAEAIDLDAVLDFAPPGMVEENLDLTLADADPPEPIEGGIIDLGEICAQQMALAMDPYPRAEGAALDVVLEALPEGRRKLVEREEPGSPFAKLAALKKDGGTDG